MYSKIILKNTFSPKHYSTVVYSKTDATKDVANIVYIHTFNNMFKKYLKVQESINKINKSINQNLNMFTSCCCCTVGKFDNIYVQPWSQHIYEQSEEGTPGLTKSPAFTLLET